MNVRVQRTIEFDRVIDYVVDDAEAIKGEVDKVKRNLDHLRELLVNNVEIGNSLIKIDGIRKLLTHIDLRMQDCQEILISYQNTKAQLDAQKYGESEENNIVKEEDNE